MANPGLFTGLRRYSRSLTIDHSQVPSTQSDFPVLVSFTDTTLKSFANAGHVTENNGYDIGFYSDSAGTTPLKWDMERYNPATGEVVAWVKIASVSSVSDTVFYMFYGGSNVAKYVGDSVNVWTNSFTSVYHLGDGTNLSMVDSVNAHNGVNHGATAAVGQIGGGASFVAASSQYIDLGSFNMGSGVTLSCWVNATSFPNAFNTTIGRNNGTSQALIYAKSTGKLRMFVNATGNVLYDGTGTNTLVAGTWYYLVLTYDGAAGLVGYVNAGVDGTAAANGAFNTVATLNGNDIGQDPGNANLFWNGVLDEVRISSAAPRSANWITCEYNNQKTSSTFVTLGGEV